MRLSTNATELQSFETHLSSEVLEDGGAVDGSGGSNPPGGERAALEVAMDPEKRDVFVGKRMEIIHFN